MVTGRNRSARTDTTIIHLTRARLTDTGALITSQMESSSVPDLGSAVGAAGTTGVATMAEADTVGADTVDVVVTTDAAVTMGAVHTAGAAHTVRITDAVLTMDALASAEVMPDVETTERRAAGHLAAVDAAATSKRAVVAASAAVVVAGSTAAVAADSTVVADMAVEAIAKT